MPRYGAKSYAVGQASCKRLASALQSSYRMRPHRLPINQWPPVGRMFMERLDRTAAVTRQPALRAHGCAEARQGWGQDPVVGGDRAAAPAEIIDLADPGEVPLDDTKVGRACAELVTKNAVAAASDPRCQCFIPALPCRFNPADAPVGPDRHPNRGAGEIVPDAVRSISRSM